MQDATAAAVGNTFKFKAVENERRRQQAAAAESTLTHKVITVVYTLEVENIRSTTVHSLPRCHLSRDYDTLDLTVLLRTGH